MKYCFLLLCIFFSLVVDAQDYRVVSRGNLHVRSGAGTEFDVIGKLASKDTVHVLKMEGTWAQVEFDGKQAYVSKKYIMPLRGTKQQSAEDFFSGLWGLFKQGPISYLPLLILLTLCFTLLVRWMFRDSLEIKWIVGSLGLAAIGVMELIFFFGYNGLPWFCFPDEVGWLWTVVNFFLYGFVLLNQLLLNLQVIREICYESGYNLSVGVYSYVVAVILAIIFYLVDGRVFNLWILGGSGRAGCDELLYNPDFLESLYCLYFISFGIGFARCFFRFFYWRSYFTRYRFVHIINSGTGR